MTVKATAEQISAAREWVADCEWIDGDFLSDYSDQQIVRGVDRHYDGGWSGFVRDAGV